MHDGSFHVFCNLTEYLQMFIQTSNLAISKRDIRHFKLLKKQVLYL